MEELAAVHIHTNTHTHAIHSGPRRGKAFEHVKNIYTGPLKLSAIII